MQQTQGTRVQPVGQEDPLEKCMATHSSILAWKIPRAKEPGGLQSMGRKESDMTEQLSTVPPGLCDYMFLKEQCGSITRYLCRPPLSVGESQGR